MPVEILEVASRVLRDNPMGDPAKRRVPIVLPDGYENRGPYPTVYFLAGFSGGGVYTLNESIWGESLAQRIERLMGSGAIGPMIVVIPDCITRLGGSQYIDSAATGAYETHLVEELIALVDERFPTRADPDHRGVMGKSSGGFGATVLAMRHPDVFGLAADHSGDKYFELCYKADIPRCVAALGRYQHSPQQFLEGFPHPADKRGRDWFTLVNMLAMASCYSPNADSSYGFDLPFDVATGELDDAVWQRWLQHDPVQLVHSHAEALRSLRCYYIDCGRWDEHYLQYGARIFTKRLDDLSIRHTYQEFDGGHMNTAHRYELSLAAFSAVFGKG
jgi:enterochelin esterase family protein